MNDGSKWNHWSLCAVTGTMRLIGKGVTAQASINWFRRNVSTCLKQGYAMIRYSALRVSDYKQQPPLGISAAISGCSHVAQGFFYKNGTASEGDVQFSRGHKTKDHSK